MGTCVGYNVAIHLHKRTYNPIAQPLSQQPLLQQPYRTAPIVQPYRTHRNARQAS